MKSGSTSGFTLLELIVALAIAAALFAVVIPSLRPNRSAQLVSSAHTLADALRLSRMRAIASNRPDAFLVDTQHNAYRIENRTYRLPSGIRVGLYTASDATVGRPLGAIRFFPDGSSTGGGVLLESDQAGYDVLVDWLTGGVSIHERAKMDH
jgi:general secretion pathway protein H